jgi:multicomponent Na+:H+ antiporter subunit G
VKLVLDILSAVLLLVGALSCLLGAIGLVTLPSLLGRLQAATKPQTLGLLLILLGTALRLPLDSAVTLVLVVAFQVITVPVVSQLVGRSAYRSGTVRPELLVVDELADRMPPADSDAEPQIAAERKPAGRDSDAEPEIAAEQKPAARDSGVAQ